MDGILLKWTNYLSGWQPRYFILEDGILSYYHSKADINNSCKGSIKVSACDITAHPTDHTRMDIVVPGEAYYYVKSSTQQDRQLWLVALGTCKARSYDTILRFSATSSANQLESECPSGEELLKGKKSELVMYRDLLTQQLYNIKMTLKSEPPNIDVLNEASALVNVTCESFIGTLEDCIQLVDLNSYVRSKDSLSPINKSKSFLAKGSSWGSQPMARHAPVVNRKQSTSRASSEEADCSSRSNVNHSASVPSSDQDGSCRQVACRQLSNPNRPPSSPKLSVVPSSPDPVTNYCDPFAGSTDAFVANGHVEKMSTDANHDLRVPTFFSQVATSFLDLKLTDKMEVPTVPFLDSCRCLVSIFDNLNEQAFIIGKLDIFGNIRKIHQKYTSSPESFATLQKMVVSEIKRKEAGDVNSATVALLWLCKSLEFTQELMLRLTNQENDLSSDDMRQVVGDVYEKVLKNYHCWVVRSAFYMILPSIPSLHQMVASLAIDNGHAENPNFRMSLKSDVKDYLVGLKAILHLLQMFFSVHHLKIKEEVD